jgi:chemotaxis family two-component system response regulator Rcp1
MNDQFIILLVEDNPADVRLTQEALVNGRVQHELHVARDLDLKLPRKAGREVLREIKEDPDLRSIPVIILTCSQAEEDILKTYDLHANGYIVKPVELEQFFNVIRHIKEFWISIVQLPSNIPVKHDK